LILPLPIDILGDLFNDEVHCWPKIKSRTRAPYLRETKSHLQLLRFFTKILVTAQVFKEESEKLNKRLSEYMSPSLEAFLVVTYANNYNSWVDEGRGAGEIRRSASAATTTTTSTTTPTGGAEAAEMVSPTPARACKIFTANSRGQGKYKGWHQQAMLLYNEVQRVITYQRTHGSRDFEDDLQEFFVRDNKKRSNCDPGREEVRAKNSLLELYPHLRKKGSPSSEFEDSDEDDDQDDGVSDDEDQQEEATLRGQEEQEQEDDAEEDEEDVDDGPAVYKPSSQTSLNSKKRRRVEDDDAGY
jgi:hypothetical protein